VYGDQVRLRWWSSCKSTSIEHTLETSGIKEYACLSHTNVTSANKACWTLKTESFVGNVSIIRYAGVRSKKIRAVKPSAMDTALYWYTSPEQVMSSCGMESKAPLIPNFSVLSHARLVCTSASSPVWSQKQISANRKAIPEFYRRFLQSLQANAHIALQIKVRLYASASHHSPLHTTSYSPRPWTINK
jgi:hypothetical protein